MAWRFPYPGHPESYVSEVVTSDDRQVENQGPHNRQQTKEATSLVIWRDMKLIVPRGKQRRLSLR
jgi:hypothetical protein